MPKTIEDLYDHVENELRSPAGNWYNARFLLLEHPMGGRQLIDLSENTTVFEINGWEIEQVLSQVIIYRNNPNKNCLFILRAIVEVKEIPDKHKVDTSLIFPNSFMMEDIVNSKIMQAIDENYQPNQMQVMEITAGGVVFNVLVFIEEVD